MNLFLVGILSLLHPRVVTVKPAGHAAVTVRGLQGQSVLSGPLEIREGPISLTGEFLISAGGIERPYRGELTIASAGGELKLIWKAELEALVAAIVAAESPANAPPAAL